MTIKTPTPIPALKMPSTTLHELNKRDMREMINPVK